MSYDYNNLLEQIRNSRSIDPQTPDVIQDTLSLFTELSTKCPMTPLLWMQYAYDAGSAIKKMNQEGALDITCQILELGLSEFPNCAMLRLFHLDCTISDEHKTNDEVNEVWNAIIASVCVGCNGGRDESIIIAIFNLYTNFMLKRKYPKDQILQTFLHRGGIFMKNGNQSLRSEMNNLTELHGITFTSSEFEQLEFSRQFSSQHLNFLGELEDDLLIAMGRDGIASPPDLSLFLREKESMKDYHCSLTYEWSQILDIMDKSATYLMGFGMVSTSMAFCKYFQGLIKQIKSVKKLIKKAEKEETMLLDEIKVFKDLAYKLTRMIEQNFERGVTECPTVEVVWEKYIKHLLHILHDTSSNDDMSLVNFHLSLLKDVATRAVRNCPYSVKLFSFKMIVIREEVQAGTRVLEPDDLMEIVKESIDLNFFPSPKDYAELSLEACRVVKQRILDLISKATSVLAFDEAESLQRQTGKKRKRGEQVASNSISYENPLNKDTREEIDDLIDDLREMYDSADNEMRKKFKGLTEVREIILREKAEAEAYLLMNLSSSIDYEQVIKLYEKMISVHQPPHPDSWRCYINFVKASLAGSSQNEPNVTPGSVAANFRFIRSLFHRSMTCTKKERNHKVKDSHDPELLLSIKTLCQDFVSFEKSYGSSKTLELARKMINEKVPLYDFTQTLDEDHPGHEQLEKVLVACTENSNDKEEIQTRNNEAGIMKNISPSSQPDEIHTVMVGKLEYKAHPFTVHISNLSKATMDIDVYELLKDKCGPIVHVRIFREKGDKRHDGPPESKCAGLVQFEERESVEKALKLNGEVGLNEKLLQITRSHQPAVSIVPPGMHRIQPKGQGRSTKRNLKRKVRRDEIHKEEGAKQTSEYNDSVEINKTDKTAGEDRSGSSSVNSILNFRPRGVAKQKKRRAIVSINNTNQS